LEFGDARRADHLLRRYAIDLLRPRTHELNPTARHDEGFEPVGAQVSEQLQHWLVNKLGVGPLEAWITCGSDPVRNDLREFVGRHPAVRCHHDFEKALLPSCSQRRYVMLEKSLKRLRRLPFGMLGRKTRDAIEREGKLEIDGLLSP